MDRLEPDLHEGGACLPLILTRGPGLPWIEWRGVLAALDRPAVRLVVCPAEEGGSGGREAAALRGLLFGHLP